MTNEIIHVTFKVAGNCSVNSHKACHNPKTLIGKFWPKNIAPCCSYARYHKKWLVGADFPLCFFLVLSCYWYRTFIQTYSATSLLDPHREMDKKFSRSYSSSQITYELCGSESGRTFAPPLPLPQKKDRFHFHIPALSKHAKKSVGEIGKELGIPKSTVCRVVKRSSVSDDVTISSYRGDAAEKEKTTARVDQMIMRNSVKDPRKTSENLKRNLSAAEVNVHSSTIRRRLIERGRIARRPRKKQLLTTGMKKKRLHWAKKTWKMGSTNTETVYILWRKSFWSSRISVSICTKKWGRTPPRWPYWASAKTPPEKDVLGLFYFLKYGKTNPCQRNDEFHQIIRNFDQISTSNCSSYFSWRRRHFSTESGAVPHIKNDAKFFLRKAS